MKTSLIIMLILLSAGLWAKTTGDNFVVANGVTYYCETMKTGFTKTHIYTKDGNIINVPNNNVKAYRLNGHLFELLPLVNFSGDTVDLAFMELIAIRNGIRLYKYCSNCCKYDPLDNVIAPLNRVFRYYIYKNGKMKLLTNEVETNNILAFFNVKVINDIKGN